MKRKFYNAREFFVLCVVVTLFIRIFCAPKRVEIITNENMSVIIMSIKTPDAFPMRETQCKVVLCKL